MAFISINHFLTSQSRIHVCYVLAIYYEIHATMTYILFTCNLLIHFYVKFAFTIKE